MSASSLWIYSFASIQICYTLSSYRLSSQRNFAASCYSRISVFATFASNFLLLLNFTLHISKFRFVQVTTTGHFVCFFCLPIAFYDRPTPPRDDALCCYTQSGRITTQWFHVVHASTTLKNVLVLFAATWTKEVSQNEERKAVANYGAEQLVGWNA